MSEKRQIVYVWNYLNWGGAQIYFLAVIKEAMNDRDILVILPRSSPKTIVGFLDEFGVKYEFSDHPIDLSPAPSIYSKLKRQAKRINAEMRTFFRLRKFDPKRTVFHVEVAPWQSLVFLSAMSFTGRKTVVTMHNIMSSAGSSFRDKLWKMRLKAASRLKNFRIVASNKDTKNRLKPYVTEEFWNKIQVAPTAVDPRQIESVLENSPPRESLRQKFGIGNDEFVVLSVGQFIDRKGRWVALDAARMLADKGVDVRFVWLTPEMPLAEDAERIKGYGLGERFRLILSDNVGGDRKDVLSFFRIADVFALPSFVEGLPIALLEAMALAIASVSTDVFAIPEAVIDGETGILIEAGDANALAAAVETLYKDADIRKKTAENGRRFVLENFDERVSARTVLSIYDELLDNRE
jgi:glycosyltransferase involved in cell wall biosynthesis